MWNIIIRIFRRLFMSLFALYAPQALILIFAIALVHFFPDGPVWPVGLFALFIIYIFARYCKW